MKKKLFSLFSLFVGFLGFSQTTVYFKYDEAGNQRYRGTDINGKQVQEAAVSKASLPETSQTETVNTVVKTSEATIDEETFWKQIRLYPVPVNDILTIDWTEEVDGLIESFSLYQHSTTHWKFQQQNIPDINKQLKINMSGYEWGVYIIRFTLKDGRIFSKNITKR